MYDDAEWAALLASPPQEQTTTLMHTLREVVAEFSPGYVYEGACSYVRNSQPSCLVAQVLYRHGMTIDEMNRWDLESDDSTVNGLWNSDNLPLSELARDVLAVAQQVQDERQSWGDALAAAEDVAAKQSA